MYPAACVTLVAAAIACGNVSVAILDVETVEEGPSSVLVSITIVVGNQTFWEDVVDVDNGTVTEEGTTDDEPALVTGDWTTGEVDDGSEMDSVINFGSVEVEVKGVNVGVWVGGVNCVVLSTGVIWAVVEVTVGGNIEEEIFSVSEPQTSELVEVEVEVEDGMTSVEIEVDDGIEVSSEVEMGINEVVGVISEVCAEVVVFNCSIGVLDVSKLVVLIGTIDNVEEEVCSSLLDELTIEEVVGIIALVEEDDEEGEEMIITLLDELVELVELVEIVELVGTISLVELVELDGIISLVVEEVIILLEEDKIVLDEENIPEDEASFDDGVCDDADGWIEEEEEEEREAETEEDEDEAVAEEEEDLLTELSDDVWVPELTVSEVAVLLFMVEVVSETEEEEAEALSVGLLLAPEASNEVVDDETAWVGETSAEEEEEESCVCDGVAGLCDDGSTRE